ncbi:MAG: cache domain-containing protein [Rubrivivax sp.]|nr:cache domain-containing protein [Rubrivivax sp.]
MLGLCLGVSSLTFANEPRASMDEAKAMLTKAVGQLKTSGKDKAFVEFMNNKGAFFDRDLRVTVLDLEGKFLVNANNPRVIGKDATNAQDADGAFYIKERMQIAKAKGKGEQRYKFLNPVTKQIENKITYFEQVGDTVVAVGAYAQ